MTLSSMRAGAAIVAEADQVGGTRLPVLRSAPPLSLRAGGGQGWAGRALSLSAAEPPNHEQGARPRAVTVWMVGTAAGPLSGDRVGLGVEVGAGASVTVRSTAASIVLGGPSEDDSELVVDVDVGPGGELCWLPEPTVATTGCRHRINARICLDTAASLVWREELMLGRHCEAPGRLTCRSDVYLGGTVLLRQELRVGPGAPGWRGSAVLAESRAVGTVLVVDSALPARSGGVTLGTDAAVLPLASGAGWLVSAVAEDAPGLRSRLDEGLARIQSWAPLTT